LASTLTERRYKHGLGIAGGLVYGVAEAADLGDGFSVGLQGMIGPGFAQLVGVPAAGGGGLLEDSFDGGWRHGGEGLSRCHVAWTWEALIHVAMMSKFW
jgi:hypothetical protein